MAEPVLLAQLAKAPVPGQVKTRLQPPLSAVEAADLHAAMVEHTCRMLCQSGCGEVQLWVEGDSGDSLFTRCSRYGVLSLRQQRGGNLGQRMATICREGLQSHGAVILVGSDAPALDADYLAAAADALQRVDAVLGPALDGGYVLLGLRCEVPELFADMPWGTDSVLDETVENLKALGRSFELLRPLPDIDRPEDLRHLPDHLRTAAAVRGGPPPRP